MRLKIRHETVYRFAEPASSVTQTLRLTPRSFENQHVARWRLDVDRNCRLRTAEDAFGNHTHIFAVDGPVDDLSVLVEGEIDTQDLGGVVRGAVERFPPALYLRETDLTTPGLEIGEFADGLAAKSDGSPLDKLHRLMDTIYETIAFDPEPTSSGTSAIEAFRVKRGVCQDVAHVFIAGARRMGVPARYIAGYLWLAEDGTAKKGGHAWAEAHVPGLGWVGFDAANGTCVTDAHVRVAVGLDYHGAAPVRGSRYGGSGEELEVTVRVEGLGARRGFRRA